MKTLLQLAACLLLTVSALGQNSITVPIDGPALPGTGPVYGTNGRASWQLPAQPNSQNTNSGVSAGCGVEYTGTGLVYTVGVCNYTINGVPYSISSLSTVTLPASDPSNPEIDSIVVNNSGAATYVQGVAAANPQLPTVDPSTQLSLTFVLVAATATTPSNTTVDNIYQEGAGGPGEWNGATGGTNSARVNLTSTSNPYQGTHDTEFGVGGTVTTTTYAAWTVPSSGTVTLSNYNALVLYLRNKAAWPANRSISVQWFSGATGLGTPVVLSSGSFGLNTKTNFTTYQQVSIPTSTFGIPGVTATSMRVTVTGSGAALTGFYLDDITLQGGNGAVILPTTLMNWKGVYSTTATYNPNDTVVSSTGCGYVALVQNTNVALTTSATWTPLSITCNVGYPSVDFNVGSGIAATPFGLLGISKSPGTISHCKFTTTTSDASVNFVFNVKYNGTNILSGTNATVTAGTTQGTISTFALTSSTITITPGQLWELDVTTGAADWEGVVSCY